MEGEIGVWDEVSLLRREVASLNSLLEESAQTLQSINGKVNRVVPVYQIVPFVKGNNRYYSVQ